MKESELVHIISQKLGRECVETSEQIDAKICFRLDEDGRVTQLCANRCNLMNETIPSEMWELKHIRTLYLRSNMLSSIPEGLLKLHELQKLFLDENQIRAITSKVSKLTKLEELDLAGNQLETLPVTIGKMMSLKKLRLNSNRITVLPVLNPDMDWQNLESIDLDGADMKELPDWLFSLKTLRSLSLSKLHLNRFPDRLGNLPKLERLYLDSTKFPCWPHTVIWPKNLKSIVLDGAHLPVDKTIEANRIPQAIIDLKPVYVRSQRAIRPDADGIQVSLGGGISDNLDENLLFFADPEISFRYLSDVYGKSEELSARTRMKDIKVVLLGAGAVGKTSLIQRLCAPNPDDDNIALESVQTTHGVNVGYQLDLKNVQDASNNIEESFTVHFWDFGGQDKYRGVNKLLLTDAAIYIIVVDARSQVQPDLWLEMVKTYAPHSPVILAANKADENPRLNLNFSYYVKKYPQLFNCLFKISCKYPSYGFHKIADIVAAIKRVLAENIDTIAPVCPQAYFRVRSAVERYRLDGNRRTMPASDYIKICEDEGLTENKEQARLLSILNGSGSCITVEDDETYVLDPNWLADYLYIFYNHEGTQKAVMNYRSEYIPMLRKLQGYAEQMEFITEFLERRGLCAVFQDDHRVKHIFIPMFLPEEPNENEKSAESAADRGIFEGQPMLRYRWSCTILPEYEFQKFLIRMYTKWEGVCAQIWQYGLRVEKEGIMLSMQLLNDGITLQLWAADRYQCGKTLQEIRYAMLDAAPEGFFREYILVEHQGKKASLPYDTLEVLTSQNLGYYCYPEEDVIGSLIPIDIDDLSQKCGLRVEKLLPQEQIQQWVQPQIQQTTRPQIKQQIQQDSLTDIIRQSLKNGNTITRDGKSLVKIYIDNVYGNVQFETRGDYPPVIVPVERNEADTELSKTLADITKTLAEIKDKNAMFGDKFDELREILIEIEQQIGKKGRIEQKRTLGNRINTWMSMTANAMTIAPALYQSLMTAAELLMSLGK